FFQFGQLFGQYPAADFGRVFVSALGYNTLQFSEAQFFVFEQVPHNHGLPAPPDKIKSEFYRTDNVSPLWSSHYSEVWYFTKRVFIQRRLLPPNQFANCRFVSDGQTNKINARLCPQTIDCLPVP